MIYLQLEDINSIIDESRVNTLTDQDFRILEQIEKTVLDMVQSYIGGVYNLDAEYKKTKFNRNYLLLRIIKHLFAYDFYSVYSVEMISDLVKYNYESSMKMLKELEEGVIPDLNGVFKRDEMDSRANSFQIWKSNPKINSIY